jgi:2-hydroxychromene-2-carboxylate isomerase
MRAATWYFDIISPFAYLALTQFHTLPEDLDIEFVPVLFAGLLKSHGHKGPAEIEAKRTQTYRMCVWQARQLKVPFTLPPAHPFNPLPLLRLLVGAGATCANTQAVFEALGARRSTRCRV